MQSYECVRYRIPSTESAQKERKSLLLIIFDLIPTIVLISKQWKYL